MSEVHRTRYLVLGSGLAGLYFALRVADRGPVTILTKHRRESSNTRHRPLHRATSTAQPEEHCSPIMDLMESAPRFS